MNQIRYFLLILLVSFVSNAFGQRTKPRLNDHIYFHSQAYSNSKNTVIYISIDKNALLTKKLTSNEQFQIKTKFEINLTAGGKSDTLSKVITTSPANGKLEYIVDSFYFENKTANFDFEVTVTDLYKNEYNFKEYYVNPNSDYSSLYFLKRSMDGYPIIGNNFSDSSVLICSNKHKGKSIKALMYENDKPAPPPFINKSASLNLASPDSIIEVEFSNQGVCKLSLAKNKSLVLSGNEFNPKNHMYLSRFPELFPYFKSYTDLIAPLKFITSRDEFSEMMNAKDQRRAFERFWLKIAGNEDQAQYLISEFYKRVKYANKHFTSYKPGWQTDRGLLYMVYGEPEYIDENTNEIKWTYGGKFENAGTTFIFYKSLNELNGDFELVRNSLFKSQWYIAMETWRSGNVYQK